MLARAHDLNDGLRQLIKGYVHTVRCNFTVQEPTYSVRPSDSQMCLFFISVIYNTHEMAKSQGLGSASAANEGLVLRSRKHF